MRIDWWTLGLQIVNFLVLIWLLRRFLYRPVLAVIARRQAEVARLVSDAAGERSEAEAARQDLDAQRGQVSAERDRLLQAAREQAAQERDAVLAKARQESERLATETRRQLEHERAEAADALTGGASRLGVEIARKLLAAAAPTGITSLFLERACAAVEALPEEELRRLVAQVVPDGTLRLVTAAPLSAAEEEFARRRLAKLLGDEVRVEQADDAALIAGIELHFPHTVIRHDWRDDLAEALHRLTIDERPAPHA